MNSLDWDNPPPPGTEAESSEVQKSVKSPSREDPALPVEKVRAQSKSPERRRRRHRSRSYSRWSRSHSRERRRRSRSRRRRRRYSSSRSRSHSPGHRRKYGRHGRRSTSRTHGSKRRSHRSRSHSYRSRRSPRSDHRDNYSNKDIDGDVIGEEDMKIEDSDEQSDSEQASVPFKNDGSFLEMFKKMQEEQKAKEDPLQDEAAKRPVLPSFGKRRGGKVLKTGLVAKVRTVEEEQNKGQDAWSVYMQEVRKYKEVHCDDDSKTRPLVK
ncbi:serine/Arginine-related protein 53 [Euwallacea fornicatus]|uniref:serine/Arginine-related protein 53 n=1 Tax=Euwallacea fornicatus TaxID=995702 RepID=UPI00338EB1F1